MDIMYYIGLDVHKKTISDCVKDASGQIHQEGKIGARRYELDCWMKALPQPLVGVQELERGPETLAELQARDELSDAGAVDRADLLGVDEDLLPVLREELVHDLAEDLVTEAGEELPFEVDDDDVSGFAYVHVHDVVILQRVEGVGDR